MAIHDETIYEFGAMAGVRDQGLLERAVDRPRNLLAYEPISSNFERAAAICVGIAKNHPFNDGNKRTALLVTRAFLFLDAQALEPSQMEEVNTLVAVAVRSIVDRDLANWLASNSSRRR